MVEGSGMADRVAFTLPLRDSTGGRSRLRRMSGTA